MGFWEQQKNKHADLGRSHNRLNSKCSVRRNDDTGTALSDMISVDLETRLEQWDVIRYDTDHPEWLRDPDFLNGLVLFHPTCFEQSFEYLFRAFDRGNLFALFAIGDLFLLNFNFLTENKRYFYGDDPVTDGMLKASVICYGISLLHEPFSEIAQERIMQYQEYFSDEEELLGLIKEVSSKITLTSLEHPEELRRLFSC